MGKVTDKLQSALAEVGLDWDIIEEGSIDEGNSFFRLSHPAYRQTLYITSMEKDGMLSFDISPLYPISYNYTDFSDAERQQLLHLACELNGIRNYNSIYRKLNKYLSGRDSRKYGGTTWHCRAGDKILTVSLQPSPAGKSEYQIQFMQVKNTMFFKEMEKILADYATENFQKKSVPVYRNISLQEIQRDIAEGKQSMARIVIAGTVTNIKKTRVKELDGVAWEEFDYPLYAGDYCSACISDGTGKIKVLLPKYMVDLSLLANRKNEWHITYYPTGGIYVVDYGIDTR